MARFLAERTVYIDTMDCTDVASVDHRLQKRRPDTMQSTFSSNDKTFSNREGVASLNIGSQLGIMTSYAPFTRLQRGDAAHPILSLLGVASREGLHVQDR
jgi:hypothetical protein